MNKNNDTSSPKILSWPFHTWTAQSSSNVPSNSKKLVSINNLGFIAAMNKNMPLFFLKVNILIVDINKDMMWLPYFSSMPMFLKICKIFRIRSIPITLETQHWSFNITRIFIILIWAASIEGHFRTHQKRKILVNYLNIHVKNIEG